MFALAMFMSLCVDVMVMPPALSSASLVPVVWECQMCISRKVCVIARRPVEHHL